jgi:hypothetical protein
MLYDPKIHTKNTDYNITNTKTRHKLRSIYELVLKNYKGAYKERETHKQRDEHIRNKTQITTYQSLLASKATFIYAEKHAKRRKKSAQP